ARLGAGACGSVGGGEGMPFRNPGVPLGCPAPSVVPPTPAMIDEALPFAEGQVIAESKIEIVWHVKARERLLPPVVASHAGIRRAGQALRKRVGREEAEARRQAALYFGLECVIRARPVLRVIGDVAEPIIRPSRFD